MPHWREGIGNVPGSDDRPVSEWTLLEKLATVAALRELPNPPPALAAGALIKCAQDAFDEIVRLRAELEAAELRAGDQR